MKVIPRARRARQTLRPRRREGGGGGPARGGSQGVSVRRGRGAPGGGGGRERGGGDPGARAPARGRTAVAARHTLTHTPRGPGRRGAGGPRRRHRGPRQRSGGGWPPWTRSTTPRWAALRSSGRNGAGGREHDARHRAGARAVDSKGAVGSGPGDELGRGGRVAATWSPPRRRRSTPSPSRSSPSRSCRARSARRCTTWGPAAIASSAADPRDHVREAVDGNREGPRARRPRRIGRRRGATARRGRDRSSPRVQAPAVHGVRHALTRGIHGRRTPPSRTLRRIGAGACPADTGRRRAPHARRDGLRTQGVHPGPRTIVKAPSAPDRASVSGAGSSSIWLKSQS